MTQSSTNASSSSPLEYLWYTYGGTDTSIDDMLSGWWRDPPTQPQMYVQKPMSPVIEPHIKTRSCKQFRGHGFGLGGSKK